MHVLDESSFTTRASMAYIFPMRLSVPLLGPRPQIIDERRLRLHRPTQHERDQDGDGGDPDGVRHAGVSAHDDVMSDPILPLAG